ncbi:hypothetical protein CI105_07795 [Candidatus Izimaplasma bacterium ZiA1]|uniref:DUF2179 domain-containing protein n=1 Tax=Candidatus Izimoplasma sp. ZiA1 TaxID=2024899 RepID=UPI000BAA6CFD|nr:hypothetical protein CI105_07795 [Candidatus Izimaplasma bacterium ZiA1]
MHIGLYFIILFVKIFEVTLATTRIVLITKGEKVKGSIIAFFEVIIWVSLAATVLNNITEDPFKVVVYALGFAIGNFTGSLLESKLAFGNVNIEVIVKKERGNGLASELREKGFAVTQVDAYGMTERREILYMHIPRKKVDSTLKLIKNYEKNSVITINDIKPVYGGVFTVRK